MLDTEVKSYFRMLRLFTVLLIALFLIGCSDESASNMEDFSARLLTLPDGTVIRTEVMTKAVDLQRGMMFRDTFPEGRGMLFVHGAPNKYQYWMYQVKVPLDIVWLSKEHQVVEISANTPPCTTQASKCPQYGGNKEAMMVLELPAGNAAKHRIKVGEVIRF